MDKVVNRALQDKLSDYYAPSLLHSAVMDLMCAYFIPQSSSSDNVR